MRNFAVCSKLFECVNYLMVLNMFKHDEKNYKNVKDPPFSEIRSVVTVSYYQYRPASPGRYWYWILTKRSFIITTSKLK
jgi:hypothetical protein